MLALLFRLLFIFLIIVVAYDLLERIDDRLNLLIRNLVLDTAERLVGTEVYYEVAQETLDRRELAFGRGYRDLEFGDDGGCGVGFDELSVKVGAIENTDGVERSVFW